MGNAIVLDPTTKKFSMREKCQDETCLATNQERQVQSLPPAPLEISDVVKSYCAGFLDGEGSIGARCHRDKLGRHKTHVWVTITNTDLRPLEYIRNLYKGKIKTKRLAHNGRKPCFILMLRTREAERIVKDVLPFLIVKRVKAEIFLRLMDTFTSGRGEYNPLTDNEITLRVSLVKLLRVRARADE